MGFPINGFTFKTKGITFIGVFFAVVLLISATSQALVYPVQQSVTTSGFPSSSPSNSAAADFNGDGALDLAVSEGGSNQIEIFSGDGAGGLSSTGTLAVSLAPLSVAAGDIDGNGFADVVVGDETNTISIFNVDSTGAFVTTPTTITMPPRIGGITDIKLADINGDSSLDLLWVAEDTEGSATYSFYSTLNDGAGSFPGASRPGVNSLGANNLQLAVGDISGVGTDGYPDFATPNFGGSGISVYGNDGTGIFSLGPSSSVTSATGGVATGDFDNSGSVNMIAVDSALDSVSVLRVVSRLPIGTFKTDTDDTDGTATPTFPLVSDVNGDGNQDVVVPNSNSSQLSLSVVTGNGDNTFATPELYALSGVPAAATLGDFDGDGLNDVVVPMTDVPSFELLLSDQGVTCECGCGDSADCTTRTTTCDAATPECGFTQKTTTSTSTSTSTSTTITPPVSVFTATAKAAKTLRLKSLRLKVSSNRTASFKVSAKIKLGKRSIKLTAKQRTITANGSYTFKFKLSGANKRKVLAYLRKGKKPKLTFKVSGATTDGQSNETYAKTIKSNLKR